MKMHNRGLLALVGVLGMGTLARGSLIAQFKADSLSAGAVTSWSSTIGAYTVNQDQPGVTALANDFNGHKGVVFNGSSSLRSDAANNPASNAGDFSVVVTFKTSVVGTGGNAQWFANSGIVDMEQGGATQDWGTAISSSGNIAGGLGNPDQTAYSTLAVNNGLVHTYVYSRSGGTVNLYVDNSPVATITGTATAARNSNPFEIGRLQTQINNFTGDIAEIQFYNNALDAPTALSTIATQNATYSVPEPASMGLLGSGGLALLARRRRP